MAVKNIPKLHISSNVEIQGVRNIERGSEYAGCSPLILLFEGLNDCIT